MFFPDERCDEMFIRKDTNMPGALNLATTATMWTPWRRRRRRIYSYSMIL
jgi:hypothetical protein